PRTSRAPTRSSWSPRPTGSWWESWGCIWPATAWPTWACWAPPAGAGGGAGGGVGTALLAEAVARARTVGAHKIALQVWPHNAAAIALYERFGFEREGYLRRHYRRRSGVLWDAIIMGLRLN